MGESAGIVLAAGSSTRMGQPKQLLVAAGKPLLEHVVEAACASRLDDVLVVLGAEAGLIRAGVRWGRARTIVNPDHAEGMSSSLRAGIAALGPAVDRALVILGDQPDVSAELLDRLLEAQEASRLPAAALSISGLLHPPVVLSRGLWPDVMALQGDVGCRQIIRTRPDLVATVDGDRAWGHPVDIDTPEDWLRYSSPARAR
ncbi:MAG TPA: nucleotidyltransferase family protein [Candidatus Binatia bacterium]|nr:nucleotidyltransferase family protein [Candidatus Binatia bacterium]